MIRTVISIYYDIKEPLELWPELDKVEIEAAIIDQVTNDSQPTFVFDRMLLMGPINKMWKVEDSVKGYSIFHAEVDFMTKCKLTDFELHAVVTGVTKDEKKLYQHIVSINAVAVYGKKGE